MANPDYPEASVRHSAGDDYPVVLTWNLLGMECLLPEGHQLGEPVLLFSKIEDDVVEAQMRRLEDNFFKTYNECFKAVHNFIPLTKHEISSSASHYMKLLRPELTCIVADENDEIAAFGLCFPSMSEGFKKARGKLFPFGWYHILKEYNHYKTIDLMMVGSSPAWNSKGLSAIYHSHLAASFREHHIACAITNPQIDTNTAAVKVWESYDHEEFMRRRCYIKSI